MKNLSQENHIPDSSFYTLPVTKVFKFEKDQKPSFRGRYGISIEILYSGISVGRRTVSSVYCVLRLHRVSFYASQKGFLSYLSFFKKNAKNWSEERKKELISFQLFSCKSGWLTLCRQSNNSVGIPKVWTSNFLVNRQAVELNKHLQPSN